MVYKTAGKITIIYVLIHFLFCVRNLILTTCRSNSAEFASTTQKAEQALLSIVIRLLAGQLTGWCSWQKEEILLLPKASRQVLGPIQFPLSHFRWSSGLGMEVVTR